MNATINRNTYWPWWINGLIWRALVICLRKRKYLVGRFFLPYDQMKHIYSVLEKYPVVLPAMWVKRVAEMFTARGQYAKHKLKAVTNPDKEKVEKQRKLMEEMIG